MRKSLTGFALAFACAAVLTVPAFAGDVTVDDVLALYAEGGASVAEMLCDVDMAADVAITVPDAGDEGSIALNGNATMEMGMTLDPLAAQITMDMSGEGMGQSGEIAMDVYMQTKENGAIGVYASGDAMGEALDWQYVEIPAEEVTGFLDALKNQPANTEALSMIPFELAEDTVDVGGVECYELHAVLTWEELKGIISYAVEQAKGMVPEEQAASFENIDETLEMAGALLSGLKINLEIDVDTETGKPARAYFDTEGSDWTILGALFAQYAGLTNEDGSLMNVDLAVNDLYLEYLYDYETPVEITVPEEAIAAEANGTVIDENMAEGLLGEALEEAESEMAG